MKLEKSAITILVSQDGTTIRIHDKTSGLDFIEVKLTPEQLSSALSRLAHTPCETYILGDFNKINKEMIMDSIEFEVPENFLYAREERKKELIELAKKATPEGWECDNYFGSQRSFYSKNGKNYAKATIRQWKRNQ